MLCLGEAAVAEDGVRRCVEEGGEGRGGGGLEDAAGGGDVRRAAEMRDDRLRSRVSDAVLGLVLADDGSCSVERSNPSPTVFLLDADVFANAV